VSIRRWVKITAVLGAVGLSWLTTLPGSGAAATTTTNSGTSVRSASTLLASIPPGTYRIRNTSTNQCVTATRRDEAPYGIAFLQRCSRNQFQVWTAETTRNNQYPNYVNLKNLGVRGCLDAQSRGGLTLHISMFDCNNSPNQAWIFNQPAFNDPINPRVHVCVRAAPACDYVWGLWPIDGRQQVGLQLANPKNAAQQFTVEPWRFQ
jgi:hypothetical protein